MSTDAVVGRILTELRNAYKPTACPTCGRTDSGRDGMSQAALATLMRNKGHKWSQATVWAIEKGERPLKFSEAIDVAGVLGVAVTDLLA